MNQRITDNQSAIAYIKEHAAHADVIDGSYIIVTTTCGRCCGTGRLPYKVEGGVCFKCRGVNSRITRRVPVKEYAQKLKAKINAEKTRVEKRQKAEAKRLDNQRDINERQGNGRLTFDELSKQRQAEREARYAAEKAAAADAPEGKAVFSGKVIKLDTQYNDYGSRFVMTVKADDGSVVWGSVPRSVWDDVDTGLSIEFTATFERSDKDTTFGFFKRPTKAKILAAA